MSNLIQALYKNALRPLLFTLNPETAHNLAVRQLQRLERVPLALQLVTHRLTVNDPRLRVTFRSLSCPNPVGLAAGFDKGTELLSILGRFGFGAIEVGTLTPLMQEGQKKPRLFRLKKDRALVNRMGFNNPGIIVAAERVRQQKAKCRVPVGINIGKGRETPLEEAAEDYLTALQHAFPVADYIVMNVSSPNTPGLRDLQGEAHLQKLLTQVAERNRKLAEQTGEPPKVLFLKISPDLANEAIEEIGRLAVGLNIGLIATNTTLDRSHLKSPLQKETGGLSGRPLRQRSTDVIRRLYQTTKGVVPIIGSGGIFSAEDAYEKIRSGASLIQVYTGWIYEGPGLVPRINRGLLRLMARDGFKTIQEAVGTL